MKKLFYVLFALSSICCEPTFSQPINIVPQTPTNELVSSVFYTDGYLYFFVHMADKDNVSVVQSCKLIKATKEGILIDSLTIAVDSGFSFFSSILAHNRIVMASPVVDGNISSFGFRVVVLDTCFNTLKDYFISSSYQMDIISPILMDARIALIAGNSNLSSQEAQTRVYWLDDIGDTLSSNINNQVTWVTNLLKIPDEDAFYGSKLNLIMKFDSLLNPTWQTGKVLDFIFSPQTGVFWKNDTVLTFVCEYYPTSFSNPYYKAQIALIDIDSTFNLANYQINHFGEHDIDELLGHWHTTSFQMDSGDLICSYTVFDWYPEYHFEGSPNKIVIRRFTADHDFVWERTIESPDTTYYLCKTIDIGDGFIVAAYKFDSAATQPNYDVAIFKFDYNGNYYQIMELPGGNLTAQVFPNPGGDEFTLKTFQDFVGADLVLQDVTGHEVLREEIESTTQSIGTLGLPSGTYIYTITQEGKLVHSGKWVKRK